MLTNDLAYQQQQVLGFAMPFASRSILMCKNAGPKPFC
jgi:hypothetical protein